MLRTRRGANALEFALCLPPFVLFVAAFLDFGWVFFHRSLSDSAIQDGCRAGALVDPLEAPPSGVARFAVQKALDRSGVGCDEGCVIDVREVGEVPSRSLSCSLARDIEPLFGLTFNSGQFTTQTQVRLEWQREE